MYIEHSLMADYFYAGLALLVIASFVAGYIDSIAGGAGLILIPAFMLAAFFKGKSGGTQQGSTVCKSVRLVFFTCFIVGFYDGFFGPGTGSIFIICLFLINNLDLPKSSATPENL
ncbi:hypothetical protein ACISK3_09675 [Morganella morganii]